VWNIPLSFRMSIGFRCSFQTDQMKYITTGLCFTLTLHRGHSETAELVPLPDSFTRNKLISESRTFRPTTTLVRYHLIKPECFM